jgi:putative transposase
MKTLKYEEVYRQEYRDLADARDSIERFLEKVYNAKRLHSALGYCPPVEFERSLPILASSANSAGSAPQPPQPVTG